MKLKMIRYSNLVFALLFLLSAILQYNDPDPLIWILLYLYSAVLCLLAFRKKFYPYAYLAGILVYSLYATYLFFAADGVADWFSMHHAESITGSMKADKPWIEATREFFGLFIMIIILAVNYVHSRKKVIR